MFPPTYFPQTYFAPTYFPPASGVVIVEVRPGGVKKKRWVKIDEELYVYAYQEEIDRVILKVLVDRPYEAVDIIEEEQQEYQIDQTGIDINNSIIILFALMGEI